MSIIIFELWTIHYNYTGDVSTLNGVYSVKNDSYSYPMFADEWVAAGMVNYSIRTKSLPLVNPLNTSESVLNLLAPFHSLSAYYFLILGLDPVTDYAIIAIIAGIFICISTYALLRSVGVTSFVSSISILLLPLLAQSGNLPGLWVFIPYTLSLCFFLVYILSLSQRDTSTSIVGSFLTLFLYPPMIVLVIPSTLAYLFSKKINNGLTKNSILFLTAIVSSAGLLFFVISSVSTNFTRTFTRVFELVIRRNLDGGIVSIPIWHVLPIVIIPFVIGGLYVLYKNKNQYLLSPVLVGFAYWITYAFYSQVIIIEYPRIAFITSVLCIVVAGVGIHACISFLYTKKIFSRKNTLYFQILILICFCVSALFYPFINKSDVFVVKPFDKKIASVLYPTQPIKRYLTKEDMQIFESITDQTFISPEWKGLVLAIATNNFALDSKHATYSNKILLYTDFIMATCEEKSTYVDTYSIDYVYSAYFNCPGFTLMQTSKEGLRLYKTN